MTLKPVLLAAMLAIGLSLPPAARAQPTLTTVESAHAFDETVRRLEQAIGSRGLVLVAKVDHAAAAKKAGMSLRPTVLLIFGNPKGGTPLMQAQPTAGIDLPMKALVWQGDDGRVKVAVNGAEFYRRHGLPAEQLTPLGGAAALVEGALN